MYSALHPVGCYDTIFWRYRQNSYEFKFTSGEEAFIMDSVARKKELVKLMKSPIVRNILKNDLRRKSFMKVRLEMHLKSSESHLKRINKLLND